MSCSVIAFSNQKGGVGKSTSVVATAGCLLGRGYTVLVIDTDPQATASSYMVSDFEKQEEGREASLYHLIMDENLSVPDSIVHTPSGDLITASFLLYDMDRLGLGTSAIKEIVDEVRGQYDFILIDTPPNLGWLQTAALEASDDIVIPTKATAQSIRGIPTFFDTVYYVQNTNPKLRILGFLITMSNKRVLSGISGMDSFGGRFVWRGGSHAHQCISDASQKQCAQRLCSICRCTGKGGEVTWHEAADQLFRQAAQHSAFRISAIVPRTAFRWTS